MTAATFQMTFDALPRKAQDEVQSFIEYISHKYSALIKKRCKEDETERFMRYPKVWNELVRRSEAFEKNGKMPAKTFSEKEFDSFVKVQFQ